MTEEDDEGIYEYANGLNLYKDNADEKIWWVEKDEAIGEVLFTFDKKTVFNFWTDYPHKLTAEQIATFQKENPIMAALKPISCRRLRNDI